MKEEIKPKTCGIDCGCKNECAAENQYPKIDTNIPAYSVREFMHNILGHPLMAICHLFGLIRLGNWIHNKLFHFDH